MIFMGYVSFREGIFSEEPNLLGCPGQEVRINGDRISGLFHPNIPYFISRL